MKDAFIHPSADVQSMQVGAATRIWQYVVVLAGARIGAECNICSHVFVENDVVVGDRVTVKCGVQLWDGLRARRRCVHRPQCDLHQRRLSAQQGP